MQYCSAGWIWSLNLSSKLLLKLYPAIALSYFLISQSAVYSSDFSTGYSSRYITEGRDNLNGNGIATLYADLQWLSPWSVIFWHGEAAGSDYDETNIALAYNTTFSSINAQVALNKVYTDNTPDDEEISVTLDTSWRGVTFSVNSTYSNYANGYFHSFSALYAISLSKSISLSPYLEIGFDNGYANDTYDGHSHNQIGLNAAYNLKDQLNIEASIAHSFAGKDVKVSSQGDISWFSLALNHQF